MDQAVGIPSWSELFTWTAASCLIVAVWSLGLRTLEADLAVPMVHAASGYDAALILVSAPGSLQPGQQSEVTVTAKNIGVLPWEAGGKKAFSIYHWDPKRKIETPSRFAVAVWPARDRPAQLSDAAVPPGGVAEFTFPIRAPVKTGAYHEDYILTVENTTRIKTGAFSFETLVSKNGSFAIPPPISPPPSVMTETSATASPTNGDWSAQPVSQGGTAWQIDPEDHVTVELTFKNTGRKTWTRSGANYLSVYATDGAKERASAFQDARWMSSSHPVKLEEPEVKPGEIGHVRFDLRAPRAPGSYQETFTLAVEKKTWLAGSSVTLPIRVPFTSEFVATAPPNDALITSVPADQTKSQASSPYQTLLLLRSAKEIAGPGGVPEEITLGFKNTGANAWHSRSLLIRGVMPALAGSLSSVRDDSWASSIEPVAVAGDVKPGEVAFLDFKLKTPAKQGTFQASFQLQADGEPVDGGEVDIPITVTADAPQLVASGSQPTTSSSAPILTVIPLNGDIANLPAEPIIRVGLYKTTDDSMTVTAKFAPLSVLLQGATVCHLAIGNAATLRYDRANQLYKLSGSCAGQSASIYVIHADDGISSMEISDYSRPVSWLPGANDNTFRAQLELRYAPQTQSVWVINELPIEWYLKGIGETSNSSPQEYQRALLTAARTYAMYHVQHASKHAEEFYIVDAHYDQVYRGYGAESRDPNVVTAVDATRGQIVTYQNQLAITPYYSRSDGRTRAWTEVWGGGPYPWLVSVPVPWDQGKTLWGHGVGLSASGALGMAGDGKHYDEILKYFYPGTELRRAYK